MAEVTSEYHSRITRSEKLLFYPYAPMELELGVVKVLSTHKWFKFQRDFLKRKLTQKQFVIKESK